MRPRAFYGCYFAALGSQKRDELVKQFSTVITAVAQVVNATKMLPAASRAEDSFVAHVLSLRHQRNPQLIHRHSCLAAATAVPSPGMVVAV